MSHFRTVKVVYKNREALVEALESMGFSCEAHDTPQNLYGYQGDKRPEVANIIVHRTSISNASNDLGFLWDEESGCYKMIRSEYDAETGRCSDVKDFPRKLTQAYNNAVVSSFAVKHGKDVVKSVLPDGSHRFVLRDKQLMGQVKRSFAKVKN